MNYPEITSKRKNKYQNDPEKNLYLQWPGGVCNILTYETF